MASSARRRRELERQKHERQEQRRADASADHGRTLRLAAIVVVIVAVVAGLVVLTGGIGGDDDTVATAGDGGAVPCEYRETGDSSVPELGVPSPLETGPAAVNTATITLDGAPVGIDLLAADAPCTVHSFAFLAAADYFDATTCHRLTTSNSLKVLQCGDPTGSGSGGPGYEFDNENTDDATYPAGTLAMANSGPDTNGSQFFLVYEESRLPPDYTVFGQISTGLDVITGIADAGTSDGEDDGSPATTVTVDDITTAA